MNPSPASPSAGTTIFEAMSRLCGELGAINLGQGFPDLPEPPELIEAARTALAQRSNQYPPMRGLPELRAAIAGYYAMSQRVALADEQIIVTSGATEALASSILALVQPGDEVILVQPLYDAYLPLVERAGGVPRFISLVPPDWAFPLEALVRAITPRTRLLVLNTPNNPTGTLLPRATLEAIGALCAQHDLTVICDEVWEAMVMDGTPHASPFGIASARSRLVPRARSSRSPAGKSDGRLRPLRSRSALPASTSFSPLRRQRRCNGLWRRGWLCLQAGTPPTGTVMS